MITCRLCDQFPAYGSVYCPAHETTTTTSLPKADDVVDVQAAIGKRMDALRTMLIAKNRAYGNSAMAPVRIFSRASADEQLRVRIDDKLSRLAKGQADAFGEDVVVDLVGYLVLLLVFRDLQSETSRRF